LKVERSEYLKIERLKSSKTKILKLLKVVVEAFEELSVHKHNAKSEVRYIKT
jgi:hypothetical protein